MVEGPSVLNLTSNDSPADVRPTPCVLMSAACCPTEKSGETRPTMGVAYARPAIAADMAAAPMIALSLVFIFNSFCVDNLNGVFGGKLAPHLFQLNLLS